MKVELGFRYQMHNDNNGDRRVVFNDEPNEAVIPSISLVLAPEHWQKLGRPRAVTVIVEGM